MREDSFMKAAFHGVIESELIFPYPKMDDEESETVAMILESIRRFAEAYIDPAQIDADHKLSDEILDKMKELGLFGLIIPEAYGGFGLSNTAYARVMEELGSIDPSLAVTIGAHQSIGLKGILLAGNAEQKRKYLPSLATGETVAAFALTEPSAGSDAGSIKTKAELSEDGTEYILNGSKIWITNGRFADVFTVFARTTDPDGSGKPKIIALIVERQHGVKNGPDEDKLGIRGSSTTDLFFDDTRVPVENVLGEPGAGFKVAMQVLNNGRFGLAAGCIGNNKKLIALATERCNERVAFKKKIGEFGMVKDKIARMMCETYALESMTYLTTGLIDAGVPDYSLESAICKVYGSESLWVTCNEALQIAGGLGYMCEYPYEKILRDARINLIFEGTNEILRAFIALSGLQGPGNHLKEALQAMREPIKGFGVLTGFVVRKAKQTLSPDRLIGGHEALRREIVLFEECTAELAKCAERVLRKHGRRIHLMQFAQKRLAEVAIDLYGLAAVISRTTAFIEQKGEDKAAREIELARGFRCMIEERMRSKLNRMERDEDELLKHIAQTTYERGNYPFGIV
ncbi:MAG: acyl-CoA dehydrogenase family protein [Myxococcota bacterium]|nr:acyl-CoA dehydrogenase family protein [Myxococcota bacterium]